MPSPTIAPKIEDLIREANEQGLVRSFNIRAERDETKGEDDVDSYRFPISFSSEDTYERWFGIEILGHKSSEVRMDWIKSTNAPLLLDHNRSDQIGVVESAKIEGRRGTAVVRFGKSARAQEMRQDVIDGIRKNISVGYQVFKMVLEKQEENGPDQYRVTDWEPNEVSLVALPADRSVGTDRNHHPLKPKESPTMTPEDTATAPEPKTREIEVVRDASAEQIKKAGQDALAQERNRITEIRAIGEAHKGNLPDAPDMVRHAEEKGTAPAEFNQAILDAYSQRSESNPIGAPDLSKQEKRDLGKFGFCEFVRQASAGKLEGLYAEMHAEAQREASESGQTIKGFGIPLQILQRDFTAGTESADIVATNVQPNFIERLRNSLVTRQLGARYLTGLQGDVQFPRVSGGATFGWAAENGTANESTPATDKVTLSPNRLAGTVDLSKQAIIQSSLAVQAMIEEELAYGAAAAIDLAALHGTGASNQPTGIVVANGTGEVNTNAGWTHAKVVEFETTATAANARMNNPGFVTTAAIRGTLKTTDIGTDTGRMLMMGGEANGYPVLISEQVTAAHAIFASDWSELMIGQWGGIDIMVNPYTKQKEGLIELTVDLFADVQLRHPASFVWTDGAA